MNKQNLNDYIEYSDKNFTKRVIFKEDSVTAFVLNFKPGQSLPKHKHPRTNVFVLVLDGNGVFQINEEDVPVEKNDVLSCDGQDEFAFLNNGVSNVSLYVLLNKSLDPKYAQDI